MAEQMFDTEMLNEGVAKREAAFPRFYMHDVIDKHATREAGQTIWTQAEYVEILLAGDAKLVVTRKVEERDRKRWPRQYADFKKGVEQVPDGFPLTAYPALPMGFIKNLNAIHCYTVEQFVSIPDSNLPPLPDIYKVREKAKDFLDAKTNAAQFNKLQAQAEDQQKELESKDEALSALTEQMGQLQVQLQVMQSMKSPVVPDSVPKPRQRRGKIKES